MYIRYIKQQIMSKLGKGKAIILFGPRRVGKTTLAKEILSMYPETETLYLDCDFEDVRMALAPKSLIFLERVIGKAKHVVIDEAQRVENIGLTLKILVDNRPDVQVIATGSSSFDLANRIKEPLTGRAYDFMMYPLSLHELELDTALKVDSQLEARLIFGSYPSVVRATDAEAADELESITSSYILKDVAELADVRQRELLPRLLRALALQIGGEVSYNELAGLLGVKADTIQRYITILEDAFIVYRLDALSGSERGRLSNRKRKVYFYDLGIRNAIIGNLNSLNLRTDIGQLWENFCVNERMKFWHSQGVTMQQYYWRGLYGEIDLVEKQADTYSAFEFKWTDKKVSIPKYFTEAYPGVELNVIHRQNLAEWLV